MNIVIQQGRLTRIPELRQSVDGMMVARFGIAVTRKVPKKDGTNADFFECVAFGNDAKNIHGYFNTGDMILVKGRLENDNYTNRENVKIYGQIIVVEEWQFGPKKKSS